MKHILAVLCALAAMPAFCAEGNFHAEAGMSYFAVRHANYVTNPSYPISVKRDDRSAWAPYLAAGYAFNKHFGLRLSYHFVDGLTSEVTRTYPGDPSAYVVTNRYDDDLHVVSLAPEFKWRASPALEFSIAPELNWIVVREEIRASTNAPAITIIPLTRHTDRAFTGGGTAALTWAWSESWALALRYRYADLDPSWDRQAHVVSAGLRWTF